LDGSLTGGNAGSWATAYFKFNEHTTNNQCYVDKAVFDGLVCDETAQVRRVTFHHMEPANMYTAMLLWIAKYDDVDMNQLDAAGLAAYQADKTNYDDIFFKPKLNPTASWAVPLVTGHKYRMYWDIGQLNWSKMKIEVANPWKSTDLNILFNYPYTENYEVIEFFGKYDTSFATSGADPLIYLPPQSLADN